MKVSHEVEEYLEAIYRKKEKGEKAKTKDLAKELRISAPSVSEMLKRLAEKGLVEYRPYEAVKLTKKGEDIGGRILAKHRLIEKFLALIEVKKNIHKEACVLEHAVSNDVEKAIKRIVKCKHLKSLLELRKGECGRIAIICTGEVAKKRLLEMGLTNGAKISMARTSTLIGPVEICVRGSLLALGRGVASKVFVKPCE